MPARVRLLIVGLLVAAAWLLYRRANPKSETLSVTATVNHPTGASTATSAHPGSSATGPSSAGEHEHIALADNLDAPSGSIDQDLQILRDIFTTWLTNFPSEGNPVGENAEITAALTGKNRLHLALIEPDNRAINSRGELVDRWGTPFRLHQLSGTRMELQSAGPDRKFATADDAINTPR